MTRMEVIRMNLKKCNTFKVLDLNRLEYINRIHIAVSI